MKNTKQQKRIKRHHRVRAKIKGTATVPRVSVFRGNKNIFVQIIDDTQGKTLLSSIVERKKKSAAKVNKTKLASEVGKSLAERALKSGISQIVFDRGGYKYHGRVKALADGLRKGGLKF